MPKILRGMGVVIMSTPKGVMTGHQAEKAHQGGEVLAAIW
ncbi:MAG TPA: 30S ribosomal protein S8 [Caldisericia bacterium]|nr:30S ribosomal protein S8 [Caldisericia bacterium]